MKKILLSLISIILIVTANVTNVLSTKALTHMINTDKQELKPGEEVTLTLRLENNTDKIDAYSGEVKYDSDIFEEINEDDFTTMGNWKDLRYNHKNHKFVMINTDGTSENEDILKLKLTVKKDLKIELATIKIDNIKTSSGKSDIYLENVKLDLNVNLEDITKPEGGGNDSNGDVIIPDDTTKPEGGGNNSNGDAIIPDDTTKPEGGGNDSNGDVIIPDDTTKPEGGGNDSNGDVIIPEDTMKPEGEVHNSNKDTNKPENVGTVLNGSENNPSNLQNAKTGDKSILVYIIILIIVVLVLIIPKINKKNRKTLSILLALSLGSITSVKTYAIDLPNTEVNKGNKVIGDLTGDKKINYEDIHLLEEYLLELSTIDETYLNNADLNCDGKITITDLSLLIKLVENTLEYNVEILSEVDKYYVSKNEMIELKFKVNISPYGEITSATINNKEYEVSKGEEVDEYIVKVDGYSNAGIHELKFSKVKIHSDIEAKVDFIQNIEVYKDSIKVNDYSEKDALEEGKVYISFNVEDNDNALISGKAKLIKDNSVIEEVDIKSGKNTISFDVDEGTKYQFKVISTYKKDEDGINKVVDEESLVTEVELKGDYQLTLGNISILDNNDNPILYLEKNSKFKLRFECTNITKLIPERVVINSKEYNVVKVKDDIYEVTLDGFNSTGIKKIAIEKIIFNNKKEIEITESNTAEIEVLKEKPKVNDFSYEELVNGNIKVNFNVFDNDSVIEKLRVVVNDGTNDIYTNDNLDKNSTNINFTPNHSENYSIKFISDYNLGNNSNSNKYQNEVLLEKEITLIKGLIELKDIQSVQLYKKDGNDIVEVREVNVKNFDQKDYIVHVTMKDMPDFYCEIQDTSVAGSDFVLELKYNNALSYQGITKSNTIKVVCGQIENDIVKILEDTSLEDIISTIKSNPSAEIILNKDLDASKVSVTDLTMIVTEFKGKLNGNGHAIKNLSKPLFNELNEATIENLIIENATLTSQNGILSNTLKDVTINNVHIKNSSIKVGDNWQYTGIISKESRGNTVIENSSIRNTSLKAGRYTGGVVGFNYGNLTIKNTYINGTVEAPDNPGGDSVGGAIGESTGIVNIENTYVDINLISNGRGADGALIGYAENTTVNLTNVISTSDGDKGSRVVGKANLKATNCYEISESKLKSNADKGIITISQNEINENFFKNTLKWDESIWNLENTSADNMPRLNNLDVEEVEVDVKPDNESLYIPEIKRLKKLSSYNSAKEIAYSNMYALMPFYEADLYVQYGNKISEDNVLNEKVIKTIIPYDKNGKMLVSLNTDNYSDIAKIKVIFDDDTTNEYIVLFNKKLSDVATYTIPSLGIGYNYNKFILNTDISLVTDLINVAKGLDYKTKINPVTQEEESRLYVDYYNESVKGNLEEVIKNILVSQDDYNLYLDNDILKTKIKNELLNDNNLEKILYTYNYYSKWYNIDIEGINVSDILFFNVKNMVNKSYDIKRLTQNTISTSEYNRKTSSTLNYYNDLIKPQNGKTLTETLEYYINIEGVKDPNDWFSSSFKGMLSEKPVLGREDEIKYRAWSLLKVRDDHLLPVLTAPQEDMYIISAPTQLIIGSMNRYYAHLRGDTEEMRGIIEKYAHMICNFYTTSSSFIDNSADILNSKVHIQYDTRFYFPSLGDQNKGTAKDPVVKWVYEAIDVFAAANGSSAYANGTDVFWVVDPALGGDYSFKVFAHETAHNQDGYYFYEGYSRRCDTWGEDHADDNIAQDIYDGSFVFNIRNDIDIESDVSNNLTLNRINSKDKIHSYYKEMFETYYVLDYLTAQAFLQLTPEEQAKLAVRVTYTNEGRNTVYNKLTADEIRSMNLQDMEDLWDNQIAFRNSGEVSGEGPGLYGGDNHYNIYWYQPHNDNGRSDSYTFKRVGFEMLGVGGYTNGYVAYRSGMTKNDLEALRKATGNSNITWREYKLQRYKEVENNLSNIPYFDANEVIKLYKEALTKDAKASTVDNVKRDETNNVRRVLYGLVKRTTNDFADAGIYTNKNEIEISTAQGLIDAIRNNRMGSYKLTADLDFSNINTSQNVYITETFLGLLDGNGFEITGLSKPLFDKIIYANIKNIEVKNPSYSQNETASLIKTAKNSMLENVTVYNSNLPIVENVEGSLQKIGMAQGAIKVLVEENLSIEDEDTKDDLKEIINNETIESNKNIMVEDKIINNSTPVLNKEEEIFQE